MFHPESHFCQDFRCRHRLSYTWLRGGRIACWRRTAAPTSSYCLSSEKSSYKQKSLLRFFGKKLLMFRQLNTRRVSTNIKCIFVTLLATHATSYTLVPHISELNALTWFQTRAFLPVDALHGPRVSGVRRVALAPRVCAVLIWQIVLEPGCELFFIDVTFNDCLAN